MGSVLRARVARQDRLPPRLKQLIFGRQEPRNLLTPRPVNLRGVPSVAPLTFKNVLLRLQQEIILLKAFRRKQLRFNTGVVTSAPFLNRGVPSSTFLTKPFLQINAAQRTQRLARHSRSSLSR